MRVAIVTATTNPERSARCRHHWPLCFQDPVDIYTVFNGVEDGQAEGWFVGVPVQMGKRYGYYSREILGVVPAFAIGVQKALEKGADIIACFHDDLEIYDYATGRSIEQFFTKHPTCGLLGFGGGRGLGTADIYQTPYNPMQLARVDFISNMKDAEAHGRRVLVPTQVACLDGFSQVGRREFWEGYQHTPPVGIPEWDMTDYRKTEYLAQPRDRANLFQIMQQDGVIHHGYDGMLGCWAKRLDWQVWMLPIACSHLGGQTAVGDPRYHQWADQYAQSTDRLDGITEEGTGDQILWLRSHRIWYAHYLDVLPIRLED
jgi:hypothetical protein